MGDVIDFSSPIAAGEARDASRVDGRRPRGAQTLARPFALAALAGCVGLLACASVAAAETGSIAGTVKYKGAELEGARVEAINAESHEAHHEETDAKGKYLITGLTQGSYRVLFRPPSLKPGVIPQYYDKQTSYVKAKLVPVKEGETKEPIDAELHDGGSISGEVTDTTPKALANIEVVVFPIDEDEFAEPERTKTEASGKYELKGFPAGKYKVGFFPEAGVNLVTQFYKEMPSFLLATEIELVEEKTKENVDAKLRVGGIVAGTVTDAASHKPLAHVGVFAIKPGTELFGEGETNANGEYKIVGMASGSYTLEFEQIAETLEYINQTRKGVEVLEGSTTTGIDAALVPTRPVNAAAPVASGTPAVGQTLSCSRGLWSGVTPMGFSYKWLRDGSASGSSGNTYVVQATDEGHGLACEVTASNRAGRASAKSNTLTVPLPPPPPPPNSQFSLIGSPKVNEKNGQITIVGNFPATGGVSATGIVRHGATLARVAPDNAHAVSSKRCKRRYVRKHGRCVSDAPVRYGASSLPVYIPGTYTIVIKPTARVLKALKAGKRLSVTISITFQNAKGGSPVTHAQSVTAKIKKTHHH